MLSTLAADIAPETPVIGLETDSESLAGLLSAVAGAYVVGAPVRAGELFADRFTRPLPLDKEFQFFASPCELAPTDAPAPDAETGQATGQALLGLGNGEAGQPNGRSPQGTLEVLRRLAAERAELPLDTVLPGSHPLDELHLSSITVGQIMNQAARELGVSAPMVASAFATSTLADLAQALDDLAATELPTDGDAQAAPDGIAPWVRAFSVELTEAERPPATVGSAGQWQVFASAGHPLSECLSQALRSGTAGDGVLLCLPPTAAPGTSASC